MSVSKTHVAKISHSLGGVGAPRAAAGSLCCKRLELKSATEQHVLIPLVPSEDYLQNKTIDPLLALKGVVCPFLAEQCASGTFEDKCD